MPDRSPVQQPQTVGSFHPRRLQDNQSRRIALLDASLVCWLQEAGWPQASATTQARSLLPMLHGWLDETPPDQWFDLLPSLAERICEQLPHPCQLTVGAFLSAFARSMIARAMDDVEREARSAGHASVFAGLRPYLLGEASPSQLADLGATLEMSGAALAIALSRLRHRFRERIESALGLWAPNPETRNTLRRQLRESLIDTESIP